MEKNLKSIKKKFILFDSRGEGIYHVRIYLYKCMTLQRMLHAYHSKNPIKFQRTFLNEKRKERKENKKEKYIIWFDSR